MLVVFRGEEKKVCFETKIAKTATPGATSRDGWPCRITRTTTPSSCRGWARTSPSSRWPTTSSRSASLRPTRRRGSP
uniref:Uncharacterized protein n=1 Tax=Bubo bubo TaxID=30461 RepID=A0A8C0FE94_BUBBB